MNATATTDPIDELQELGELPHLHARIRLGIVAARAHNRNPPYLATVIERLRGIADAYVAALVTLLERSGEDAIQAQLADIERRLDVGWTRRGAAVDDRWVQLLTVQEILQDALSAGSYLVRLEERIAGIAKAGEADADAGAGALQRVQPIADAGVATMACRADVRAGGGE